MKISGTREEIERIKNSGIDLSDMEFTIVGSITDEEIDKWAKFSDHDKAIIKDQYSKYPEGFFPNPWCALH